MRLAEETGASVKFWHVKDSPPFSTSMEDLQRLLTDKTKIVALPHVSNLLGEVYDVAAVVRAVRSSPAGQCTPTVYHCISSHSHAIRDNLLLGTITCDVKWCLALEITSTQTCTFSTEMLYVALVTPALNACQDTCRLFVSEQIAIVL